MTHSGNKYYKLWVRNADNTGWTELKRFSHLRYAKGVNLTGYIDVIVYERDAAKSALLDARRFLRLTKHDSTNGSDGTEVITVRIHEAEGDQKSAFATGTPIIWTVRGFELADDLRTILFDDETTFEGTIGDIVTNIVSAINTRSNATVVKAGTLPTSPTAKVRFKNQNLFDILLDLSTVGDGNYVFYLDVTPNNESLGDFTPVINMYPSNHSRYKTTDPTNMPSDGVLNIDSGSKVVTAPRWKTSESAFKGFWRFNEGTGTTAYNNAAEAHHATLYGAPVWTADAIDLDGTNDYARITDHGDVSPTTGITISYKVYLDTLPATGGYASVARKEGAYILQYSSDGKLRPHVYVDGAHRIAESAAGAVKTGVWQRHTLTYDATSKVLKGYVGATEVCSLTLPLGLNTYNINDSVSDLFLGSSSGTGEFVDGRLKDVRIVHRAYTATEVSELNTNDKLAAEAANNIDFTTLGIKEHDHILFGSESKFYHVVTIDSARQITFKETRETGLWNSEWKWHDQPRVVHRRTESRFSFVINEAARIKNAIKVQYGGQGSGTNTQYFGATNSTSSTDAGFLTDADSITNYDRREMLLVAPWIQDQTTAEKHAQSILNVLKGDPADGIRRGEFTLKTSEFNSTALTANLGDVIGAELEDGTYFSGKFLYVEHEQAKDRLTVTAGLPRFQHLEQINELKKQVRATQNTITIPELDDRYINYTGDEMTGTLTMKAPIVMSTGSDIRAQVDLTIRQDTADGTDNRMVTISGGGDHGGHRGAGIRLHGNEHTNTGQLHIHAGNVAGGEIKFYTGGTERAYINNAGSFYALGNVYAQTLYTKTHLHVGDGNGYNNNGNVYAGHIQINEPGAGEGIAWGGTGASWKIDVSPEDRTNVDGNLNLYGTANSIVAWRPVKLKGTASDLTVEGTGTSTFAGGVDVTGKTKLGSTVQYTNVNYRYYPNVVSERQDTTVTGAWVIHSPIARDSNDMFRIRVHGYGYGAASNIDFTIVGYPYSGQNGPDGVAGNLINYSLIDHGNDGLKKWVGTDANGKVAVAFGDTDLSAYFYRVSVDAWVTQDTTDYRDGWSITQNATSGFGWIQRHGPLNSKLGDGVQWDHAGLVGVGGAPGTERLKVHGDALITGNLTVSGTTTSVNSTNMEVQDNIILLNSGETGSGVSLGTSGIQVDRGTLSDAQLVFDESTDTWRVSTDGGTTLTTLARETRSIATGTGLSGGGDLSADRTLSVDQNFAPTWTGAHTFKATTVFDGANVHVKGDAATSDVAKIILETTETGTGSKKWAMQAHTNYFELAEEHGVRNSRLTVRAGGLVGVNTESPAAGLDIIGSGLIVSLVPDPAAPTVTTVGTTGTTSYTYYVVAEDAVGRKTNVSGGTTITTGNATLSSTNYNKIEWSAVAGAAKYYVLKTNTSTLLGSTTNTTLNDTGQVTSAFTAPTRNATADSLFRGRFTVRGDATYGIGVVGNAGSRGGSIGTVAGGDFNKVIYLDSGSNVGIGTATPGSLLDIKNTLQLSVHETATNRMGVIGVNANWDGTDYNTPDTNNTGAVIEIHRGVSAFRFGRIAANATTATFDHLLAMGTGDSYLAANGGQVGIGTSTPDHPLHVIGNIYSSTTVQGGGLTILGGDSNGALELGPRGAIADLTTYVPFIDFHYARRDDANTINIASQDYNLRVQNDKDEELILKGASGNYVRFVLKTAPTLWFGGDVNLYRSAANQLKTDDSLVVATDFAVGGGNVSLNNTTSNIIDWNTAGVNPPATTTRSTGTKLVLYPQVSSTQVDYALGIESNTLWSSVPGNTSTFQFKWYGGTTEAMKLTGEGNLTLAKSLYLPGSSYTGAGQIQSTGVVRIANGNAAQGMYVKEVAVTDSWADADTNKVTNGIYSKANIKTAAQLVSTVASGTAPLAVTSTTVVANLNADLLDGQHGSYYAALSENETITGAWTFPGFTSTGSVKINNASAHFYLAESGTDKWHLESVNGTFKIVETGVAERFNIAAGAAQPTYNGNAMWHAGNDGSGSGLDADLLDGLHYDRFGRRDGNATTIAASASAAAGAWYRIASNGPVADAGTGGRVASGLFTVSATVSGYHDVVTFYASYQYADDPTLVVLQRSAYGAGVIRKIRLVYGGTYEGAAVEVYLVNAHSTETATVNYQLEEHKYHTNSEWTPVDFTAGSIPTGHTSTDINLDTTDAVMAIATEQGNDQFYINRSGTINATLSGNASTATALQTARNINGVSFDGTANITVKASTTYGLGLGTHLSYSSGTSWDGGTTGITLNTDATSANTVGAIVARDASGNFSAGTITATLSGNASTASAWATARTITLDGDVSGSVSLDGSANVTLTATVANDSHTHSDYLQLAGGTMTGDILFSNVADGNSKGIKWTGNSDIFHIFSEEYGSTTGSESTRLVIEAKDNTDDYVVFRHTDTTPSSTDVLAIKRSSINAAVQISSSVATGTAPFSVTSTTKVTNLNADLLDDKNADAAATANTIVARDASGNFAAGTITATLSGNASTATALQTARTINGVSFDGTANITVKASTTNALTIGSYLTGTSFDGGSAVTIAADATTAATPSKLVARDSSGHIYGANIYGTPFWGSNNHRIEDMGSDALTARPSGFYQREVLGGTTPDSNYPETGWHHFLVVRHSNNTNNYQMQFAGDYFEPEKLYYALVEGGVHSGWFRIWHSGNDGTGTGLDADKLDGMDSATANTASTIVARDASGNFSAGTITATLSGNASSATKLATARTINGVAFDGTANITITAATNATLTRGAYLTGNNFDGSAATTWAVDATSSNTVSKVVARDSNGDFSAGTISASFSGPWKIPDTRSTAVVPSQYNKEVVWDFKGSGVTGLSGSYAAVMTVAPWSDDSGGARHQLAFNDNAHLYHRTGTEATPDEFGSWYKIWTEANVTTSGTGISVSGTTISSNATNANTASTIVARDASGDFAAGTITATLSGNASSATKLATARTINGVSFDGTANITVKASTTNILTRGSYLTGNDFDGGAATTWAVDAASSNVVNKVVARDASGNFDAEVIGAADVTLSNSNQSTSIYAGGLGLLTSPETSFDHLAYHPPSSARSLASDGTTWTDISISSIKGLFVPNQPTSYGIARGTREVEFTWNNITYAYFSHLHVWASGQGNSVTVYVDSSSDGTTWTNQVTTTNSSIGWPGMLRYTRNWHNNTSRPYLRMRFVFTWNGDNTNGFSLYRVGYYGSYPSFHDQTYRQNRMIVYGDVDRNAIVPNKLTAGNLETAGSLSFGSDTRQMVNLWNTSYGIGIQNSTVYLRTGKRFSVHRGGSHSDTENTPGTNGTALLTAYYDGTNSGFQFMGSDVWHAGNVTASGTGISVSGTTISSNATDANTASAIVARDASGNFSAGTITATLSGNASTATKLATARNINGVAFDGSANITVKASTTHSLGLGTHLSFSSGTSWDGGTTGITIGTDATSANTVSTIVARDASGNFSAGTVTVKSLATTQISNIAPFYIKGTGLNNSGNRIVRVGGTEHVNAGGRGLTLTILKRSDYSLVSSTTYDTYGSTTASDNLATALDGLTRDQIAILTSFDAWEASVTTNLNTAFKRIGLSKAWVTPDSGSRRPYAAIFGSYNQNATPSAVNGTVTPVEVLRSSGSEAPSAEITGWIINGQWVTTGSPTSSMFNNLGTIEAAVTNESGVVDFTSTPTVGGTAVSLSGHAHSGADITSGLVGTAYGGTGLDTSAATKGQLLIGNGSGLTLATLTAGSNVTITNGAGSITIAATDTNTTYTAAAPLTLTNTEFGISAATTTAAGSMSSADKTKLDGIAAGAEVNQNAFSTVTDGITNIAADSKTDTLTIVGGGATTLTYDDANDKITISSTDTTYTAGSYLTLTNGQFAVNADTANTASAVVARDASGDFSAGTITATGITSTGNVTINSGSTLSVWDSTGTDMIGLSHDGTNAYIDTVNAAVIQISTPLKSTVATGTAPFTVASTTTVTNLNADTVDGIHGTSFIRSDTDTTLSAAVKISGSSVTFQNGLYSDNTLGVLKEAKATSTALTKNSNYMEFQGAYWNGTQSVDTSMFIQTAVTGTDPTYRLSVSDNLLNEVLSVGNKGLLSTKTSGIIGFNGEGASFTYETTETTGTEGRRVGQLKTVVEGGITVTFYYDTTNGDRISKVTTSDGTTTETLTYTYDADGKMTGFTRAVS